MFNATHALIASLVSLVWALAVSIIIVCDLEVGPLIGFSILLSVVGVAFSLISIGGKGEH